MFCIYDPRTNLTKNTLRVDFYEDKQYIVYCSCRIIDGNGDWMFIRISLSKEIFGLFSALFSDLSAGEKILTIYFRSVKRI